jgi:hypothetical protein
MPESPQPTNSAQPLPTLPERVEKYREIVERVITEVGEHPDYEMKRACLFQSLSDRIEFVKDVQSIATSRIESEKYLVIGADEKSKQFFPVTNLSDFDDASIRQMLDRYLSPVPVYEVFQLKSSNGHPFVLFVIAKQRSRRILAKVTVTSDDQKQKLLLREGDLWTKGSSTGKRLARVEDWDEIYEEVIEAEAERRARTRTTHMVELAVARERVKPTERSSLPSVFSDEEFQALMEELCARRDEASLRVLLERLRDEVVEGWNSIDAFETFFPTTDNAILEAREKIRDFITNVLRPSMHWLTLAGLYAVKNSAPASFLEAIVDLLREVFETAHRLETPQSFVARGSISKNIEGHISHATPALESLISLYLIGAYLVKRNRFEYLKTLFRAEVYPIPSDEFAQVMKKPMAFWPLVPLHGEPEVLKKWGGRIRLCTNRVMNDTALRKLFGSENATGEALARFEFCMELNSFVAFPENSPDTGQFVQQVYVDTAFDFRPSFTAYPLAPIHSLATTLFREIKQGKAQLLKLILFDPSLAPALTKPGSINVFADFLNAISRAHGQMDRYIWRNSALHHFLQVGRRK